MAISEEIVNKEYDASVKMSLVVSVLHGTVLLSRPFPLHSSRYWAANTENCLI